MSMTYHAQSTAETNGAAHGTNAMSDPVQRTVGRYRIVRLLAEGGFAKVFEALAPGGRRVAVKIQQFGEERRFLREAALCASLRHPGIVRVFDSGRDPESQALFMVMEFVPYPTLEQLLLARRRLSDVITRDLMIQVADVLDYAYAHADIAAHRDIKPSNLFVSIEGRKLQAVKLADFGVHRARQGLATIGAVGDFTYAAPEQLSAEDPQLGAQADIYALGCMAIHMLTGKPPFAGDDWEVAERKMLHAPENVALTAPGVHPGLAAIVNRCVDPLPERRFANMHELIVALRALDFGGPAKSVPPLPVARRDGRIGCLAAAATLVTIVFFAAGLAALLVSAWRPDDTFWLLVAGVTLLFLGALGAIATMTLILLWQQVFHSRDPAQQSR